MASTPADLELKPEVAAPSGQVAPEIKPIPCPVALPGQPRLEFHRNSKVSEDAFCQPVAGPTSALTRGGERALQGWLAMVDLVTGEAPEGEVSAGAVPFSIKGAGAPAVGALAYTALRRGLVNAAAKDGGGKGPKGPKTVEEIMEAIRKLGDKKGFSAPRAHGVDDLLRMANQGEHAAEAIQGLETMVTTRMAPYVRAVQHLLDLSQSKSPETQELAIAALKRVLTAPLNRSQNWDSLKPEQVRSGLIEMASRHPTRAREILESARASENVAPAVVEALTNALKRLGFE